MLNHFIEPLESRIAPATILTSAAFTSETTVVAGSYDGGVDGKIEVFAHPLGAAATSLGTLSYVAANGPGFQAVLPAMMPGTSFSVIITPLVGLADAESNRIGATRGLWVDDVELLEGNATHTQPIVVKMSLPSSQPVTVQYTTAAIDATPGADYTTATGSVTFLPGETAKTVDVTILGDTVGEALEGFFFQLTGAGGTFIADASATVKLLNDDASGPAAAGVFIEPLEVSESAGTATVRVSLSRPIGSAVEVQYGTANDSATDGADFTGATGTLTFNANETSKTFTVPISSDTTVEGREHFIVGIISATAGLEILSQTADVAITDDDAPVGTLSIADVAVVEGTSATNTRLTFIVTLSSPAVEAISLRLSSGEGTAKGSDFQGGTGTLTFDVGDTSGSFDITVRADSFIESNETFFLSIDQVLGVVASDTFAVGTITNDDAGLPAIEISDVAVTEANAAGAVAVFSISLSVPATTAVTVDAATGLGTALAGIDYAEASGRITFLPGETLKTVNIAIVGDTAYETTENFGLTLSNVSANALIADSVGVGTILDNDPVNTAIPQLRILDREILEGTGTNRNSSVVVLLDHAAPAPVTVQLNYRSGQAVVGRDFGNQTLTVNIPAGADSGMSTFEVVADFALEPNESFFVDVVSATGASVVDNRARVTLLNDDSGPDISEDQKTARWRDVDGDLVTLTATKGILTTANFAMIPANDGLVLGALFFEGEAAAGISLSITAKGSGDKRIAMGGILAEGVNLGAIKVAGDITRIKAGSGPTTLAVAKLDVGSIGTLGTTYDLESSVFSEVTGRIGNMVVAGNFGDALMYVNSGTGVSIGRLRIGGQLRGGSNPGAGYIFASGDIGSIDIKGGIKGSAGFYSGTIQTLGSIGKITIGASVEGGTGDRSGGIFAHGFHTPAATGIGSVTIKGILRAGSGGLAGAIYSYGAIPTFTVGGLDGGFIASGGIGKLTILHDVIDAAILSGVTVVGAGFANPTTSAAPVGRPTAGFGKVTVGGNWIGSSLSADVDPGADGFFGGTDDRLRFGSATVAAIQSIVIKGNISGSIGSGDGFGFVARTIGSLRAANATPILQPAGVDVQGVGAGGDVSLREVVL